LICRRCSFRVAGTRLALGEINADQRVLGIRGLAAGLAGNSMQDVLACSVLAVGVELPPDASPSIFSAVGSGCAALQTLRLMQWDLLLAGCQLPDMPVWSLIEKVRRVRPWQKWGLIARDLDPDDERLARVLGAALVLDELPPMADLLDLIRRINQAQRRPIPASASAWRGSEKSTGRRPQAAAASPLRITP
jgi:CheY-like chemotaxis protein